MRDKMKQYILNRDNPLSPSMIEVPNEKVPTYSSLVCAEADLANLEEGQIVAIKEANDLSSFDIVHPIGEVYVQYPQQASPNDLWGSFTTWEELDYNGAFFRSSGGNANGFATSEDLLTSCVQASSIKCHTHTVTENGTICCGSTCARTLKGCAQGYQWNNNNGCKSYGGIFCYVFQSSCTGTSGVTANAICLRVDACHRHCGDLTCCGSETRPENYTVKLWKRVA